jgi:hypothetical protein
VSSDLTVNEIGKKIHAHLKRFERDPVINVRKSVEYGTVPYYNVYARGSGKTGKYVYITYISYQGHVRLSRDDAEKYLAWLEAGNVGRHFEALC